MQTLKAVRAFQNNWPDYWIIYEGKQTFGADPVARCDSEEHAAPIVHAVNTLDEAKAALADVSKRMLLADNTDGTLSSGARIAAKEAIKAVLAKLEGKE